MQAPPSDVERVRVLSRLIHARIAELERAKAARISFTPENARELYVLEELRDSWLLEAHG